MAVIKEHYEGTVKHTISEFLTQALPDETPTAPVVYDLVPGEHFETLSWDQEALTWSCIDDPEDPLPDPTGEQAC